MSPVRALPAAIQTLTRLDQWVTWRWEHDEKGKPTKVPYQAHLDDRGHPVLASSTDANTWASYEAAESMAARFDGTGFMVSQGPYCGIDLDHCISPETGQVASWAQAVIDRLKSYTEETPSGTGLRVWITGALPKSTRRVFKQPDEGRVEIYDHNSARYFTVTGRQWGGCPETIEPRQAELEAWHAELVAAKGATAGSEHPPLSTGPPPGLDDVVLLAKAERARNGVAFARLWAGVWAPTYTSQSEADLALCGYLAFWTGPDAGQIDRLFRQSGLMRAKWDEPHGALTYGGRTIQTALDSPRATYDPSRTNGTGAARRAASRPSTDDPPPPRVRFRSGSALDATPLTYLVEDMIPTGMLGALGGKDGMGKTLFGMQIIKSVLTGEKLFDRFAVQQGPVYALFLDDPEFLVRERLAAMDILDHPHLHVATENDVDMTDPKAMLTSLIALLKAAEPRPIFIFVDALYLFIPSGGASDQGNSAGAMGPVIEAFNRVTRETGSALLLVAHDNKAGSDIAGSYAIRAGLKSVLRVLFPPAIAKKIAKGDEEARETPERMLQLNKLKTGRPASWYLRLDGPGQWMFHGDARAYRKATLPGRVIESLWGRGESTVEEIAKDLRARPAEVRAACVTLYLADRITKAERPREDGNPGREATVYGPKVPAN
jgi:hypothetical protein